MSSGEGASEQSSRSGAQGISLVVLRRLELNDFTFCEQRARGVENQAKAGGAGPSARNLSAKNSRGRAAAGVRYSSP